MSQYLLAAFVTLSLLLSGRAVAEDAKLGAIEIVAPWARATPGGAKVGAGYLTLKNDGDVADRLVSASAEIADSTEIHEMSMIDGVMKMRPLPDGVALPAGGEAVLKPGGNHLMFLGLKRPLVAGETFACTLAFEKAGTVEVTFKVEGTGASSPSSSEHQGH